MSKKTPRKKTPFSVGRTSFVIEDIMQMDKDDFIKENKEILGNPGKAWKDMKSIHEKAKKAKKSEEK